MKSKVNEFFSNCDNWGAKEWFDRLVMAVEKRNDAFLADDSIGVATYNNIVNSSATRLVLDFKDEIRMALGNQKDEAGKILFIMDLWGQNEITDEEALESLIALNNWQAEEFIKYLENRIRRNKEYNQ